MYLNTNLSALQAENSLSTTMGGLGTTEQQIATGNALANPATDPAAAMITTLSQGHLGAMTQASNNVAQGIDLLNTANGAIQGDIQIVQQMQQLAVQASNGTNTPQDRADLQAQVQALAKQIDQNSAVAYNGQPLLTGALSASPAIDMKSTTIFRPNASFSTYPGSAQIISETGLPTMPKPSDEYILHLSRASTAGNYGTGGTINNNWIEALGPNAPAVYDYVKYTPTPATVGVVTLGGTTHGKAWSIAAEYDLPVANTAAQLVFTLGPGGHALTLQTGSANTQPDQLGISLPALTSTSLGLADLSFTAADGPQSAQVLIAHALSHLTNVQSGIGAQLDQLQAQASNLRTGQTQAAVGQAALADTNLASATSQASRQQILMQTGMAALVQANQQPHAILRLLQSA